jgi:hypothetical protein
LIPDAAMRWNSLLGKRDQWRGKGSPRRASRRPERLAGVPMHYRN